MSSESCSADAYRRAGSLRIAIRTMLSRSPLRCFRSFSVVVPAGKPVTAAAAGNAAPAVSSMSTAALGRVGSDSQMARAISGRRLLKR